MYVTRVLAVAAIAAGLTAPASAATIASITGTWEDASPSVSGEGTSEIRWGTDAGWGRSGYDFDAATTPLEAVSGSSFSLGTFTHLNFPVRGTFLDYVDLRVSFTIDGVAEAFTSVFSFDHLETWNAWDDHGNPETSYRCDNGGANGSGVNLYGCADRVTATLNPSSSQVIEVDGVSYVLDVLGFQVGAEEMTEFWTVERATNSAQLIAALREVPASEVPLPASVLLLLGGVAGLFAQRRLRA